jgi:xylulokinase
LASACPSLGRFELITAMYVGVDIGTQSLKVVVTDECLVPKGTARRSYRPDFPRPGRAEQAPEVWERALAPAIAEALATADIRSNDVRGLGLCSQLDGCIAVDDASRAIGPCLLWMDRRATDEVADIPHELVRRRTGIVADAGHMAAKVRWLKRHRLLNRPARFHQPVSYMVERLTGSFVIDHALASTSMVCALDRPRYDPELLDLFEIDEAELPRIDHAGAVAGRLHGAGASMTGLPTALPVAVGTGDDFSTVIGAGLVAPGRVAVGLGTGEVVGAVHPSPLIDDDGLVETHPYPTGGFFIENPGWLGGGSVVWLMSLLGLESPSELDDLAASAPPGSAGVIFLPCLSGAMAPRWRAEARGCFYGLTSAHGRAHMARAVLEGTAFAMRDVVERLDAMGVAAETILLLGGGARSRLWAEIRADIAGRTVSVPHHVDTCPIGAAMLAAMASGAMPSLADAAASIGGESTTFTADPGRKAAYDDAYAAYRRLFDTLEPIFS